MGVRHVVISPGSRSTPLTLAAAANDRLKKHVILDERSAAFTALGIGKATNIPAVLVCTSGTALANYYPAVIEARQSGVPMILATADRPPRLRATGANQSIDQLKLFGDYPVFQHEVGEPREEHEDLRAMQMLAKQAFTVSRERRGPVHLNFPFRKPLEPESEELNKNKGGNGEQSRSAGEVESEGDKAPLNLSDAISRTLSEAKRPVIIAGPLAPEDDTGSIARLAEELGCPLLSEAGINSAHAIKGFAGFLRAGTIRNELSPDLIVRFGFQPTAKALEEALASWQDKTHIHFSSTRAWQDATFSGSDRIYWGGRRLLLDKLKPVTEKGWYGQWKQRERRFLEYRSRTMEKKNALTDGSVYRQITPQITEQHFIAVSNSFPARDIQLFGNQSRSAPLFLNRGASGIDGITSTALGISLSQQKPGVLFTGDLAFLHDTNALLNRELLENPLLVVVINNGGGSIFRMLPIARHSEYFNTYFETPQSAVMSKLVEAYDIPYQQISSVGELEDMNLSQWFYNYPGLSVIECKTDPDASMQQRKKLWEFE